MTGESCVSWSMVQLSDSPLQGYQCVCHFYSAVVEAMCMDNPICDLIIGNVLGARATNDQDLDGKFDHGPSINCHIVELIHC
jgi:hypothetical protein